MAYMMKYKVGDKVIILAKSKSTTGSPPYSEDIAECIGKSGFIEEIYRSGETFRFIVFKSLEPKEGYMGMFLPRELRLYTEAESIDEQVRKVLVEGTTINYGTTSTPHKYKVGDRVRVTKNITESDIQHKRAGIVETINNYYPENFPNIWQAASQVCYSEDQLELVTDKPQPKFKIGDKVRVIARIDGHGFRIGHTGKITSIKGPDSFIVDGEWWLGAQEFEKVEEKEWRFAPPGFNFAYIPDLYGPSMPWFMGTDFAIGNEKDASTPKPKGGGIMKALTNLGKRYLSPSAKRLLKAGYITEGFNRTSKGEEALMDILWQKHEKELLDAATKQIKADKKAKKNEDSDEEE